MHLTEGQYRTWFNARYFFLFLPNQNCWNCFRVTVFDVGTHWVDVGGKVLGCDDGCGGGRGGTDMTAMVLLLSP
jgi:hypothetical protein